MPRPNYGSQSKKRTKCLLEVLIGYANGEFEVGDRFESQIRVNWQTEKQLVVRTKVRYLQALIAEIKTEEKLSSAQLKESLKRLKDFLEILEDNRCSTQGSDRWHFTLKLWHHRLETAANLAEFDRQWEGRRPPKSKQSTPEISPFHPDGKRLATASDDSTVQLWDANAGECLKTLWGHESWVHSVSFSCEGLLATGSRDKTVKIWDIETGECLQTFAEHLHRIKSVAFSPCGKILASGSDDQTLKIWEIKRGICLKTLSGHSDWVLCVMFSPCGKILASAGGDRTVKLWEVETGKCVRTLTGHRQRVRSVAFNNDGNTVIRSSDDHTVKVWNWQTGDCVYTCQEHRQTVGSVACCPDGKIFANCNNH